MSEQMRQLLEYLVDGMRSGIESPLVTEILQQIVTRNILESVSWLTFFSLIFVASFFGIRWGFSERGRKFSQEYDEAPWFIALTLSCIGIITSPIGIITNFFRILMWLQAPKAQLLYEFLGKK